VRTTLWLLFITIKHKPYISEIIEIGQALAIMSQISFVLKMESSTLRGALPLSRESFEHSFFWRESGVVLAKASVKDAARTAPLLELLEKSFLPL
jgi:hypothetical protein